jgi:S-adenosylmethionine:tRNA ribosyltransferase-isomerase
MIAAERPVQRPRDAKLLVVDARGGLTHARRSKLVDLLRPGDLVIANDAATLPASLRGVHAPSGAEIEVRLAGRSSLRPTDMHRFSAVVFGSGDFRARTGDRPLPPPLARGDRLLFGRAPKGVEGLSATVETLLGHPRLVRLRFSGSTAAVWAGLARDGRPIQYAHMQIPLALWDVWTPIAALPVAFEPPSASFALNWASIRAMRARGIAFRTVTLAAGLSSTGDPELDLRLPFDEPYCIPETTASAIHLASAEGRRIIAIGTTVVRALEHAARRDGVVRQGEGVANQRIGLNSKLAVVSAILTGTHEPADSHYQVLRAFADDGTLTKASAALEARGYRTHEFGDSLLVERGRVAVAPSGRTLDLCRPVRGLEAIRGDVSCRQNEREQVVEGPGVADRRELGARDPPRKPRRHRRDMQAHPVALFRSEGAVDDRRRVGTVRAQAPAWHR